MSIESPKNDSQASENDLLRYRSEFPILDRTTYLISNSLGAAVSRAGMLIPKSSRKLRT